MFRFRNEGCKCLLSTDERCSYLETAILPMKTDEWKNPSEARRFAELTDQYRRAHISGLNPRKRKCPDCGVQIGPRKRYCQVCAERRSKQADRNYHSESTKLTARCR